MELGPTPGAAVTLERLRAHAQLHGLGLSDQELEKLLPQVSAALDSLGRLWRYSLENVDTAVRIPTEGRR
jgi:hypothetical protein